MAYADTTEVRETRSRGRARAGEQGTPRLTPRLRPTISFDALLAEDAPTDVSTDAEGTRIVTVGGLPCPCGGTHVASSGAIGAVTIEALKKKGSGKSTALRVSYSMSD